MANALSTARQAIESEIRDLESQVERLRKALAELSPNGSQPARRRRSTSTRGPSKRAPRGQREAQFLEAVKVKPGVKAGEIAAKLGISANQTYGLANRLTKAGKIRKHKSGGYAPKA